MSALLPVEHESELTTSRTNRIVRKRKPLTKYKNRSWNHCLPLPPDFNVDVIKLDRPCATDAFWDKSFQLAIRENDQR